MPTIKEVRKHLEKEGLFCEENELDGLPFLNVYRKKRHLGNIDKSTAGISFSKKGKKITNISIHALGVNAIYFHKKDFE